MIKTEQNKKTSVFKDVANNKKLIPGNSMRLLNRYGGPGRKAIY